jgi:hypothetical protein
LGVLLLHFSPRENCGDLYLGARNCVDKHIWRGWSSQRERSVDSELQDPKTSSLADHWPMVSHQCLEALLGESPGRVFVVGAVASSVRK